MADVVITAANVQAISGEIDDRGICGETLTAGLLVYLVDGKYKIADVDAQATAEVAGMALNGGALNQPVEVLTWGEVEVGAALEKGKFYILSDSGAFAPSADVAQNDWVTFVGVALSTNRLKFQPVVGGVQHPAII